MRETALSDRLVGPDLCRGDELWVVVGINAPLLRRGGEHCAGSVLGWRGHDVRMFTR